MKKTILTLCVVPFLTMPAFAGSSVVVDKPMVVAQGADIRFGGVGIEVGERDRYRDQDRRRYHRDRAEVDERDRYRDQYRPRYHRDRAEIVINRPHRHHDRNSDSAR
jgi:hypothetical protein